jgi:hypothetical protein
LLGWDFSAAARRGCGGPGTFWSAKIVRMFRKFDGSVERFDRQGVFVGVGVRTVPP